MRIESTIQPFASARHLVDIICLIAMVAVASCGGRWRRIVTHGSGSD